MKKILKKVFIFCLFLTFNIWSAIYYVDNKNPSAKDTNPGTEKLPFKTIKGALPHLKPGDTLYIKEGTYRECIALTKDKQMLKDAWFFPWLKNQKWFDIYEVSGKSGKGLIHITAYPGEEVYVKGSDVVTGWKKYKGNIYVADWKYNSQQVFCDGEILQQIGGHIYDKVRAQMWKGKKGEGISDMTPGSFYYDIEGKKLYVWLSDNSNPDNHLIEASVRPLLVFLCGAEFIKISDIKFYHANATSSPLNPSFYISWPSNHITLENIEVCWTDFTGLYLSGYLNTVINSKFNWNGNSGIGGSGWGHRIENCQVNYNNYRYFYPGWHAGGIKIIPYAYDIILDRLIVSHNKGCGIWFDQGCSSVTIQNCIINNNEGNGIFYEISNHGIIRNNIVYENSSGIVVQDSEDCLVLHNLVYRNALGIRIDGYIGTRGWWGQTFGREKDQFPVIRNNVVWGNILIDNGESSHVEVKESYIAERADMVFPDPEFPSKEFPRSYNNISDYNIFWRSDGKNIKIITGSKKQKEYINKKVYTFKQWQEETGNDIHSKVIEPKFVNLKERDFRPAPGSPAIGFVKPHISARYDFYNRLRLGSGKKQKFLTAGPIEFFK